MKIFRRGEGPLVPDTPAVKVPSKQAEPRVAPRVAHVAEEPLPETIPELVLEPAVVDVKELALPEEPLPETIPELVLEPLDGPLDGPLEGARDGPAELPADALQPLDAFLPEPAPAPPGPAPLASPFDSAPRSSPKAGFSRVPRSSPNAGFSTMPRSNPSGGFSTTPRNDPDGPAISVMPHGEVSAALRANDVSAALAAVPRAHPAGAAAARSLADSAAEAPAEAQPAPDYFPQFAVEEAAPRPTHGGFSALFEREVILDPRVRAVGLIPLFAFILHYAFKAYVADPPRPEEVLWMCHVAALLQAVGLLASWLTAIRVASAWAFIGFPNFLLGALTNPEGYTRLSWFTHFMLPVVALLAISQARMDRRSPVFYVALGTVFFLFCQQVARWFTPEQWNINLAHRAWAPVEGVEMSYPFFFLIILTIVVTLLSAIYLLFSKFFGPDDGPVAAPPAERTVIAGMFRRALR